METTLLSLGALIIGWLLGWFPNRQRQDHYTDMRDLVNQFASLSAQMINNSQAAYFPTPPEPTSEPSDAKELQQVEDESFFDMAGGAP